MNRFCDPIVAIILLVLTGSSIMLVSALAWAGRSSWEAGLLAGASYDDEEESFNQVELHGSYGLPWSWQWGRAVQVDTRLSASLGVLDGGGETGLAASAGFAFVFGSAAGGCPFELRAGSTLTLLTEDQYGEQDFGGPLQFTHYVSLYYWFLQHLSAVARIQHMSNAGIYNENPGLDMVMLGLVYRF